MSDFGVDGFEHAIDGSGQVWQSFGVRSQPAFAFIDDDTTVDVRVGQLGIDGMSAAIEELIAT